MLQAFTGRRTFLIVIGGQRPSLNPKPLKQGLFVAGEDVPSEKRPTKQVNLNPKPRILNPKLQTLNPKKILKPQTTTQTERQKLYITVTRIEQPRAQALPKLEFDQ